MKNKPAPATRPAPATANPRVETVAHVFADEISDCLSGGQVRLAPQLLERSPESMATTRPAVRPVANPMPPRVNATIMPASGTEPGRRWRADSARAERGAGGA